MYDKHRNIGFSTSVKNIMAERRFNDFSFEDWIVSFESIAGGIEDMVLPAYRRIVENRCLDGSPQEKADLGFLVAFQSLRTKANRDRYQSLENLIKKKVEAMGHRMDQVQGWEPLDENALKKQHLMMIRESLPELATITAQKDFF